MGTNQDIGIYGEQMAAEYLRRLGMQVLQERWRCRFGEIDLKRVVRVHSESVTVGEAV